MVSDARARLSSRARSADPKTRVLTTAKHFPGHGDTSVDSHLALPSDPVRPRASGQGGARSRFARPSRSSVDSVMTAHIAVPALDAPDVPATLSRAIMTGLLRDELKFNGLVVTDALEMGGVAKGLHERRGRRAGARSGGRCAAHAARSRGRDYAPWWPRS